MTSLWRSMSKAREAGTIQLTKVRPPIKIQLGLCAYSVIHRNEVKKEVIPGRGFKKYIYFDRVGCAN